MSEWVSADVKSRLGHKVLLAGLSEAGKTAVKKLYFSNTKIKELSGLQATLNYERLSTTINGTPITILDLGGQRVFIKRFLSGFSPFVFSSVKGLIFVIDVSAKSTRNNSLQYFLECLKKLKQFSPKAEIFVYLHKTDLIKNSPNFNTVLQLIMEQFQVETSIKIRFFFTSIYEPDSVIKSFLRIFEIILPEGNMNESVGQIEHYTTVKFTSKNIETEDAVTATEDEPLPELFQRTDRGSDNQLKIGGDLSFLKDIQSLMQESTIDGDSEEPANVTVEKPFQMLSSLQDLIKKGITGETGPKRDSKYLLSILSATDNILENPNDVDDSEKDFIANKVLSTLIQDSDIVDLVHKEIEDQEKPVVSEPKIEPVSKTETVAEGTQPSTIEPEPEVDFSSPDVNKRVGRLVNFYGMRRDDAENIIKFEYEDIIYELIVKSNIPMPVVLNVLLVSIPYLRVLGNNTSVLTNEKILDIFRNFLTGRIMEREMFSVLERVVKNPDKSIDEILAQKEK